MREVTSTFNIFEHGRTTHNNRPYLLQAVKRIINSKKVQESLKLGELFGYYGHGKRQLSNKLNPSEIEVITIQGKQVVIEQVPSNITIALSVDDDGNVTHTQRILDTPTGLIVDAMEASNAGGWSWAASGDPDNFKGLGGFDYVKRPSYIDNEKRTKLMLESVGLPQQLMERGIESEEVDLILESWESSESLNNDDYSLKLQCLMLESIIEDNTTEHKKIVDDLQAQLDAATSQFSERKTLMLESLNSLPILPTDEQKKAFLNPHEEGSSEIIKLMFESAAEALASLPAINSDKIVIKNENRENSNKTNGMFINLSEQEINPFATK